MNSASGEKSQIQVGILHKSQNFCSHPVVGEHLLPAQPPWLCLAPSDAANAVNLDNVLLRPWPGCPPTACAAGPRYPEWPIVGLLALDSTTFSILRWKHTDWVLSKPHLQGVTVPALSSRALY